MKDHHKTKRNKSSPLGKEINHSSKNQEEIKKAEKLSNMKVVETKMTQNLEKIRNLMLVQARILNLSNLIQSLPTQ